MIRATMIAHVRLPKSILVSFDMFLFLRLLIHIGKIRSYLPLGQDYPYTILRIILK